MYLNDVVKQQRNTEIENEKFVIIPNAWMHETIPKIIFTTICY